MFIFTPYKSLMCTENILVESIYYVKFVKLKYLYTMELKYKYLLGKRDKPTNSKAKFFVLQKIPCEKYISSCYHVKDDVYEIEFKGKRTRIDLSMDWQKMVYDFINNRGV